MLLIGCGATADLAADSGVAKRGPRVPGDTPTLTTALPESGAGSSSTRRPQRRAHWTRCSSPTDRP